ncbi:MAG: hypothetical protein O3B24_05740 [Verrucomicrobia bacterium]|nr:hypothetical protein [Verrucomicrobiota bacterium]
MHSRLPAGLQPDHAGHELVAGDPQVALGWMTRYSYAWFVGLFLVAVLY